MALWAYFYMSTCIHAKYHTHIYSSAALSDFAAAAVVGAGAAATVPGFAVSLSAAGESSCE